MNSDIYHRQVYVYISKYMSYYAHTRHAIFNARCTYFLSLFFPLSLLIAHSIFRRAFASRLFPPATIEKLGIKHVKGMLLHGPPGTGKTLIARQIGKLLAGKEPKVVNGPDVLNKFVGQTEENIRKLFLEAEEEYAEKGEKSELHIIIFDEIDAICKKRGSTRGGTGRLTYNPHSHNPCIAMDEGETYDKCRMKVGE